MNDIKCTKCGALFEFISSENQLRLANNKIDNLSIKKLAKDNLTIIQKPAESE